MTVGCLVLGLKRRPLYIPMDFPRSRYFSSELELPGTSQAWLAGLPGKVQAPIGEHMSERRMLTGDLFVKGMKSSGGKARLRLIQLEPMETNSSL